MQHPEGRTAPGGGAPFVEIRGITKRYGPVVACDAVSLSVVPGEVHGLLGQNGAGKSTLAKILIGLVAPEKGEIYLRGARQELGNPIRAAELGISMVHQHFSLIDALTVWENVALGDRGRVDARVVISEIEKISVRYGLPIDPHARVADLSAGQRQRVEVVKCLRRDPGLFILDEPTSVLTLAESRELFTVLGQLVREEHRAVILISHKLDEVLHATDRITIMRDGAVVSRMATADADARLLAREMVGREVLLRSEASAVGLLSRALPSEVSDVPESRGQETAVAAPEPEGSRPATGMSRAVLSILEAEVLGADGSPLLNGLSLDVGEGEIVGLAGVEGNGQAALSRLCSGLVPLRRGHVIVAGNPIQTDDPGALARAGVAVVPADRLRSGCILEMSVAQNLVLNDLRPVTHRGFFSPRRLRSHAVRLIREFGIVTPSPDAPMWSLSGGNQQRVVLARELSNHPRVLVAVEPTAGLDVGAIEDITNRLRAVARSGVGILLISTELGEILSLADRVAVIFRGRIVGEMGREEVDIEALGLLMGGRAA